MGRPKGSKNPKKLNFYGLPQLGYAEAIPLVGDWNSDQLAIEMICFRIGLRRREGGLGKFGHLKRLIDLAWNNEEVPSTKRFIWCREAEKILRECCRQEELGVAGPSSLGKTDPLALWCVANFIADPTHTLILMMSTTIDGAKRRIWKTMKEYLDGLPDYPGKPAWSSNRLLGPTYSEDGFGESSGIYLLAGEKSREKDALEKLIGIKAPATGEADESLAALKARPEFADLAATRSDDELEDLLPRLQNLTEDRTGKIIFAIDEATGIVDSILNAIRTNMKPANKHHLQVVMAANPNLHWDVFGQFCRPADENGYEAVSLKDDEWETATGGLCIRFNAEKNSRIVDRNPRISWMLTKKEIEQMAKEYGEKSPYYYRFVLGMWCPAEIGFGIYSQADLEQSGSMKPALWGYQKPVLHSSLDPSFSVGGDKSACTFFKYGEDTAGRKVMEVVEQIPIKIDASNTKVPVSYQVVREWRKQCEKRGVTPRNAAFDATGGGITFAAIVHKEWSPSVQAISTAGKASTRHVGGEKNPDGTPLLAHQRFNNKSTEVWYGAHPFLRSSQLRGIPMPLAKELCSRKNSDKGARMARTVAVETKKDYIKREGHSPDDSDSYLIGIEHLRSRHAFKPVMLGTPTGVPGEPAMRQPTPWDHFKARARKITVKGNQRR